MIDFEVFQEDMRTGEPTKIGTVFIPDCFLSVTLASRIVVGDEVYKIVDIFIPTYDCDSMYKGSFNLISGAKLYVE